MDNNNATNMLCANCGFPLKTDALFCPRCGQMRAQMNTPVNPVQEQMNAPAGLYVNPPQVNPPLPKPKKKGRAAIVVLAVLMVVFAAASAVLAVVTVNLNSEVQRLDSDNWIEKNNYKRLKEDYDVLKDDYDDIEEEYSFYHKHAVVYNSNENEYYHQYGCPYFNDSSFNIFNSKLAESKGIKPCPYCMN